MHLLRTALTAALALSPAPLAQAQTLLGAYTGQQAGDRLQSVAGGADLNGDGVLDLAVGEPFDSVGGVDAGAVRALSGVDGATLWTQNGAAGTNLGYAVTLVPDLNGDGVRDVLAGAPQLDEVAPGGVSIFSGATGGLILTRPGTQVGDRMGTCVAGDFDYNKDGTPDFAAGAPAYDDFGPDAGRVALWNGLNGNFLNGFLGSHVVGQRGFGTALAGGGDVDGDGFKDFLASAVDPTGPGRVVFYALQPGGGSLGMVINGPGADGYGTSLAFVDDLDQDGKDDFLVGIPKHGGLHFGRVLRRDWDGSLGFLDGYGTLDRLGSSVAAIGDVDGDGRVDWAAGAQDDATSQPGYVRVISGKFQTPLFDLNGSNGKLDFPRGLAGVGDVNGDGVPDLAVTTSDFDVAAIGNDTGRVQVFSGGGPGFVNYCTAGTTSSGCTAAVSGAGTPAAAFATPFTLSASGVEGDKSGLFFFGWNGRQAAAWGNGTSLNCVTPPVKRTPLQPRTGTPGLCDGGAAIDLNAHWQAFPGKNPGAGAVVQAQFWYRDPFNTSNQKTAMSDALEFAVGP